MKEFLRNRVNLLQNLYNDYNKQLGAYHQNKLDDEGYKTILRDGKNETKILLSAVQEEVEHFNQGLNPPFMYG